MSESNITIRSNIYILKEMIEKDEDFLQKVRDKDALEIIKKHTDYGFKNNFTEEQRKILDEPFECNQNRGKEVFGLVIQDGEIEVECRCEKEECSYFKQCRPNYENESGEYPANKEIVKDDERKKQKSESFDYKKFIDEHFYNDKNDFIDHERDYAIVESFKEEPIDKEKQDKPQPETKESKIKKHDKSQAKGKRKNTASITKQTMVINAPSSRKILVNAGPGTGKTYSLIERIKYLVEKENIDPAKLLVLSFSRAAAAEINKRLCYARKKNNISFNLFSLYIKTFDSFCTRLLVESNYNDLEDKGYNERIRMAVDLIKDNSDQFGEEIDYFIVDEIQDVVGIRAELVKTILSSINCGFTLLGDSCQAIYSWAIENDNYSNMNSDDLYNWVKEEFKNDLMQVEFDYNHRQENELQRLSAQAREVILDSDLQITDKTEKIRSIINDINSLGPTYKLKRRINKGNNVKTTAYLCRTNGEVLKLSRSLKKQNIQHSIKKRIRSERFKPWVGKLFGEINEKVLSRDSFVSHYLKTFKTASRKEALGKWKVLKEIENSNIMSRLRVSNLVESLQDKLNNYNDLLIKENPETVLSTIHRAKGNEYDRVVLLNSINDYWLKTNNEDNHEIKTGYVGMTRPRLKILKTHMREDNYNSIKKYSNRYIEKRNNNISLIEVSGEEDVDIYSFISNDIFGNKDQVFGNQEYIRNYINKGDQIKLKKEVDGVVEYYIYHGEKERLIGKMSQRNFTGSIGHILHDIRDQWLSASNFPREIHELYVEDIVTFTGNISHDIDVPDVYRNTFLWNGIIINGFGRINNRYN